MRRLRSFLVRVRNFLQRERIERELAEELATTLQMHIDENLRSGMTQEEARCAALRSFGGVEQTTENCRDACGLAFLETLLQDLQFGVRLLLKSRGFTLVAVLTLALAIGVNTTVFTFVNTILFKGLPVEEADRLALNDPFWNDW